MKSSVNCSLCQAAETEPFLKARDYTSGQLFELERCCQCGFVFTHPQPPDLGAFYPRYYRSYGRAIQWLFKSSQQLRVTNWSRQFNTPGLALEIGCGAGWMLDALRRQGWDVIGIERSIDSARFAVSELNLPVLVGDLTAFRPTPSFDLIVLNHVLEHLPDPCAVVVRCASLLKPGGVLVIAVPNLDSWQFRWSREHWMHLDVPRHLNHFTIASLSFLLEQGELSKTSVSFLSWDQDPFGWMQSILNKCGFPQNLILQWLMGQGRERMLSAEGLLALLLAPLLLIVGFLLSLCSWLRGAGACMEVRATSGST